MVKMLVTGSSGNIGSKIAETVSFHQECVGVDLVPGKFTTYTGSITDKSFMKKIIPGVDVVIHSAAYLTPHIGLISDAEFSHVNVQGTEVLLNLAIQHNIKRFVFTSTTSVYGCTSRPKTEALWVTEDLDSNPEDIYDQTKLEAERLCRDASGLGTNTIILRMSRCFPEPDNLQVFYRLYRGVGGRDAAMAHYQAAMSALTGNELFIISAASPFKRSESGLLFNDPWKVVSHYFPEADDLYARMHWQKPQSIDRVYVIEKAKKILNYHPQENFFEFLMGKVR